MQLDDLRGWMQGEDAVVVGCGPSAQDHPYDPPYGTPYTEHWTIACNRAVAFAQPDFAVCVEPWRDPIWATIRKASPIVVFTHLCESKRGKKAHPRAVEIGAKDVLEWLRQSACPMAPLTLGQSPFFASAVATLLGFETVGVIGVDLTEDRYPDVRGINRVWKRLADVCGTLGTRLVNLNPESRLDALPAGSWDEIRTKL